MDMNTLNESHKNKLKEFELGECKIKNNNKPNIKQLIKEAQKVFPSAEIVKSPRRNELERVCSKQTNKCSIDTVLQDARETLNDIFKVARLILK